MKACKIHINLHYSSFDSRACVVHLYDTLGKRKGIYAFFIQTNCKGEKQIKNKKTLQKKPATEHSLHLTDLRGGATQQIRKA